MNDELIAAKIFDFACSEVHALISKVPNPASRDIYVRIFRTVNQKFDEHGQLLHSLEVIEHPKRLYFEVTANKKHTRKITLI